MAQSGHANSSNACLLLGVKRISRNGARWLIASIDFFGNKN